MRIEDVNESNIHMLSTTVISDIRSRANQLFNATENWREQIEKNSVGVFDPIQRDKFLDIYSLLFDEIQKRKLKFAKTDLDIRLMKHRMRGIDVGGLPILTVRDSVVLLTGEFVKNPKKADIVDIFIDADEFGNDDIPHHIEKRMAEQVLNDTGLSVCVSNNLSNLEAPVIPLYDLVLVPRNTAIDVFDVSKFKREIPEPNQEHQESVSTEDEVEIEFTDISKPFIKEHTARQLSPAQFDDFRRQNDKFGSGIHAIWGIKDGKTKLASIRFDASEFTVDEANAWLKEHKYKAVNEPAKVKKDKTGFVKSEEQHLVGGIVYEIMKVDAQGDAIESASEIWKAIESFAAAGSVLKFMHSGSRVNAYVVESFQPEIDTPKGGEMIPAGSWYMTCKILDENIWQAIKDGEITGYSMAGKAHARTVG